MIRRFASLAAQERFIYRTALAVVLLVFSHITHLLIQIFLIAATGRQLFGEIGLAKTAVLSLVFISDMGYGQYFTREAGNGDAWRLDWQQSVLHRLVVLVGGAAGLIVFWAVRYGVDAAGTIFIMGSLPGIALSAFNLAPVLFGQRRSTAAAIGQPMLWAMHGATMVPAVLLADAPYWPILIGLSLSAGFAAQIAFFAWVMRDASLFRLRLGRSTLAMRRSATKLWLVMVGGVLYDRTLPFMVEIAAPGFLAYYLILEQVLVGMNSITGQIQRMLLPELAVRADLSQRKAVSERVTGVLSPALAALTLVAVLTTIVLVPMFGPADLLVYAPLFVLIMADWFARVCGSLVVPAVLAERGEGFLVWVLLSSAVVSLLFQMVALASAGLLAVLLIRLVTSFGLWLACHGWLGQRISRSALFSSALLILFASALHLSVAAGTMAAVLGSAGLILAGLAASRLRHDVLPMRSAAIRKPLRWRCFGRGAGP